MTNELRVQASFQACWLIRNSNCGDPNRLGLSQLLSFIRAVNMTMIMYMLRLTSNSTISVKITRTLSFGGRGD